jgi:hypothetical protein
MPSKRPRTSRALCRALAELDQLTAGLLDHREASRKRAREFLHTLADKADPELLAAIYQALSRWLPRKD